MFQSFVEQTNIFVRFNPSLLIKNDSQVVFCRRLGRLCWTGCAVSILVALELNTKEALSLDKSLQRSRVLHGGSLKIDGGCRLGMPILWPF